MSKKRMEFPMDVRVGSVIVKIYRVRNKSYKRHKPGRKQERFSFLVSYHANGKRYQKMFAKFEEAFTDAEKKGDLIDRGELDVLKLGSVDSRAYVAAQDLLKPIGVPLELAVKDYVEAWKVLGGKASLLEAAKEFVRRHMHELPKKMLPEAVDEMLKTREKDGTGEAYLKVLKVYLTPLKTAFNRQLGTVTTGQLSDYFRNMEVSPRSRNNARATVGAFFRVLQGARMAAGRP